jgi:prepilin-type N-terminal cleavage/methylation domain-containing protein
MNTRNRSGFTLVELTLVVLIASVVVAALYSVLISSQRAFSYERATVRGNQVMRAGMEVLFSELREISPQQGDLIAMNDDTVTIRAARAFGLVCQVSSPYPVYNVRVRKVGDGFQAGDSAFIFADNDIKLRGDDVWVPTVVRSASTSGNCGGDQAQEMSLTAGFAFAGDSVSPGAEIRAFKRYTYGLMRMYFGETYLARWEPGIGNYQALVGPLDEDGLSFVYQDSTGAVTNIRNNVRQIRLTLRTSSPVRGLDGDRLADSLTTTIFTRN